MTREKLRFGLTVVTLLGSGILEVVQLIGTPVVASQVGEACLRTGCGHCAMYIFHSAFFWVELLCVVVAGIANAWYDSVESKLAKIVSGVVLAGMMIGAFILAPVLNFIYLAKLTRNARHIYRPTDGQLFFMYLSGATFWILLLLMSLGIWCNDTEGHTHTQPDTRPLVTEESALEPRETTLPSPSQAPGAAVRTTPLRPPSPESQLRGECPICYEMIGLHLLSPCGHPICRACFRRLQSRECPACRRHIDTLVTPFVTGGSFLTNLSNRPSVQQTNTYGTT